MRKIIYKLVAVALVFGSLAAGWLWMDCQTFLHTPLHVEQGGYHVEVPHGGNLNRLASVLYKDHVISSRRYLVWYARLSGNAHNIKTGEYELTTKMTPVELVAALNQGKVIQYSLTIVEGWTFRQLISALKVHPQIVDTVLDRKPAEIMAAPSSSSAFWISPFWK